MEAFRDFLDKYPNPTLEQQRDYYRRLKRSRKKARHKRLKKQD